MPVGYVILVKTGKFSKAKGTTMLSLAIFVDVRLRETVVIICDCRTISLITIFIHFGGKGTHNFSTDKTGGCSILGIFPNIRRKLGFFMQNQLGIGRKLPKSRISLGIFKFFTKGCCNVG